MDVIDGMKTFVAAVRAGSFTAASERLGISKKLVSKYVGQLEDRLKLKLLHRTTRRLSLTEAGERYYTQCVDVLERFEALEAGVRGDARGISGELRISAPASFGELFVQPLVTEFQNQHPDVTVNMRFDDHYVDLAKDGFDLALRIGALNDTSMIARRLATTSLLAVVSQDYLDRNGRPETPFDLTRHDCIIDPNLRSGAGWPFVVDGTTRKVQVAGPVSVNSATTARNLACAGRGIALVPDYAVAGHIADGRLEQVLAEFSSLSLDIHAVYLDARYMPRHVRAMIDFLVKRFAALERWDRFLD